MKSSKPLLDVLLSREPERRPVWLMRQAGRYLPEYRELRKQAGSFLDLCYAPKLACEVTLQPLRRFDLDAAILFSDILVVPHAMGLKLDFVENEGPRLETVQSLAEVQALQVSGLFEQFELVAETVSRVAAGLGAGKTLIGFCGAPWTVASYMIEGGSSKRAKALATAIENPGWFEDLINKLVEVSVIYLKQQVAAGAEVVQIFDSWAGDLPENLRERLVIGPIAKMVRELRAAYPAIPVIVFARGVGDGHAEVARAMPLNAVSVEQGYGLSGFLAALPSDVVVQGNLDPSVLLGSEDELERRVTDLCASVPMRRHVFNLGHGITPLTPPQSVERLVSTIRAFDGGKHV